MKLIRNLNIKVLSLLISIGLLSTSCNEFLDINDDPNFASDASNVLLLPSAQASYVLALSSMIERSTGTMVQHYINGRFSNWGFNGASYGNDWVNIYAGSLADFEVIIKQAEVQGDLHYSGVAKIQKAYIYSILVDLFGDVPFSEALGDNFNPSVDLGEEIYPQLITMIDDGIVDLNAESTIDLGSSDLIYNGNVSQWIRLANTLKLRLHNQTRLVDPTASATAINTILAEGNIISNSADDFTFQFTTSNAPEGRHPNFQADWAAGSLENNLSSFFISRLNASNDPRIPYFFYRQNSGAALTGVNGGEASSPGDDNVRAIHGIYPAGGAYDDGSFQIHNQDLGLKGAGIFPMITSTNAIFIQAETALMLGTSGNPRDLLEQGINSSMTEIASFAGVPMVAGDVTTYVNNALNNYDNAANDEERLAVIMNEKYVAMFGNGIDSYNDSRRTGHPNGYNTPIVQNGPYPNIFPIPPVEVTANENIDALTDLTQTVFWDL